MSGKVCFILMVAAAAAVTVAATESSGMVRETRQARQCPAGEDCTPLEDCLPLRRLVLSGTAGWEETMRAAHCGGAPGNDRVCCSRQDIASRPGVSGEDLLPSGHQCGQSLSLESVFDEDVKLNSYPWLALLGYQNRADPQWLCGGVLLNDRYVLTSAHCAHRNYTALRGNSLETVRLGEHVISTNPDCRPVDGLCAPSPQDFAPQEIIIHSDFNTRGFLSDDLALIRLDRRATLGDSVHPLCLPPVGVDIPSFLGGRDAIVAGWGRTNTTRRSDILQAAKFPFVEHSICNRTFQGRVVQEQVCFGEEILDHCIRDAGGPVFQVSNDPPRFVLLAIDSYGLVRCGHSGAPAIFTNVASYRQWIVDNIKP